MVYKCKQQNQKVITKKSKKKRQQKGESIDCQGRRKSNTGVLPHHKVCPPSHLKVRIIERRKDYHSISIIKRLLSCLLCINIVKGYLYTSFPSMDGLATPRGHLLFIDLVQSGGYGAVRKGTWTGKGGGVLMNKATPQVQKEILIEDIIHLNLTLYSLFC